MKDKFRAHNLDSLVEDLARARDRAQGDASLQLATIQEQIDAISRGDFEATLQNASPDIQLEIYMPPEFPFIARARGISALREAMAHNFAAVVDQQPTISNIITSGDVVVMFGTERGRLRATGAPYHVEFVHRFTFDGCALRNIRIIAARAT